MFRMIAGGIVAILLLIVGINSFTIVEAGHVGVVVSLGKVQNEPLYSGFHPVNPFTDKVEELDVRTLKWEAETQAYTNDVQQADVRFTLTYSLDPAAGPSVYRDVGREWANKLISQVVFEKIKNEFGKAEAVKLVGQRQQVAEAIGTQVRTELAMKHILIDGFQLTNIDYTDEFEGAVEAKVVASQKAIEEQNRTVQIREQATQKVAAAEAEAESMRIRARALESNARLVEWEAVQKWNGVLPQYQLGGATPFISLPNAK